MLCFSAISMLLLLYLTATIDSLDKSITISLDKAITYSNKELYGDFFYLNNSSTLQVNIENVNKNVSYIIFQVHSHLYGVTVYKNALVNDSAVFGTNLGLHSSVKSNLDTFYIVNSHREVDVKLLISVHGYKDNDPIPGGCNMEFPKIPISPYIRLNYNKDYINVDIAPAKITSDPNCMKINYDLVVTFYMMYLPESDFTTDAYLNGIRSMMTLEGIRTNGTIVPYTYWGMRRMISVYPGTGVVYVAVARINYSYSVYVPGISYACSPLEDDGCELIVDELSKLLCALMLFIGIFVCYMGHRFFKTEMFLSGFVSGLIVTYILISMISVTDRPALITASAISGVFFGAIWTMLWWFYGIPVVSVLLPSLNFGFLCISVIYYALPGGLELLTSDFNFWTIFILTMLITAASLMSVTLLGNLLCCSVLGGYAAIYPIDYYLGSNLKYILINVMRRATVPGFKRAVLMPPFQWRDLLITALWVTLAGTGLIFQYYYNRNRPPFPPPPRSVRPEPPSYESVNNNNQRSYVAPAAPSEAVDERTPLLA